MAAARPGTRDAVHCPHFGACGGCSLLDRPYALELAGKTRELEALLASRPRLARAELLPIQAARHPLFYRTVLKVPFGATPRGPVCGFFQAGSHRIVDLRTCAIQHPLLTELLLATRELAAELDVPVYREQQHRGLLRHLLGRVAPGTGSMLAGLVTTRAGTAPIRRLARALHERLAPRGLVGVVENENPRRTNAVAGRRTVPLVGEPTLLDEHDGLRWRASITSFVQAGAAQASVLYALVLAALGDVEGRAVADLFAGAGPIALRAARAGALVTAIEHAPSSVRDGIAAARENGLHDRVRFLAADAADGLLQVDAAALHALVADPPRRGLSPELVELLCELAVPRIVYVSCNPVTLVRDLDRLARAYDVRSLQPVDLFPRTAHLEVVARLERRR